MICMSVCSFSTNLIVTPWRLPHLSFGGFPGQQAQVVLAISSILLLAERKWIYESSLKVRSAGHTRHLFQDFYWQHARFQRFGESNNRKQFGTNIYKYIIQAAKICTIETKAQPVPRPDLLVCLLQDGSVSWCKMNLLECARLLGCCSAPALRPVQSCPWDLAHELSRETI